MVLGHMTCVGIYTFMVKYTYIYIHITINFYIPTHVIRPKTIVLVTNRVPVARFGLKLRQNGSYGLQEPIKTPPAPP